jgi:hypothetical protein
MWKRDCWLEVSVHAELPVIAHLDQVYPWFSSVLQQILGQKPRARCTAATGPALPSSVSQPHHDVSTTDHVTRYSQRRVTAATSEGPTVHRHLPCTTHRIGNFPPPYLLALPKHFCLVGLEFFSAVLSGVQFFWDVSLCHCASVLRRSTDTLHFDTQLDNCLQLLLQQAFTYRLVWLRGQTTFLQYSVARCITRKAYGQQLSP